MLKVRAQKSQRQQYTVLDVTGGSRDAIVEGWETRGDGATGRNVGVGDEFLLLLRRLSEDKIPTPTPTSHTTSQQSPAAAVALLSSRQHPCPHSHRGLSAHQQQAQASSSLPSGPFHHSSRAYSNLMTLSPPPVHNNTQRCSDPTLPSTTGPFSSDMHSPADHFPQPSAQPRNP